MEKRQRTPVRPVRSDSFHCARADGAKQSGKSYQGSNHRWLLPQELSGLIRFSLRGHHYWLIERTINTSHLLEAGCFHQFAKTLHRYRVVASMQYLYLGWFPGLFVHDVEGQIV